MSKNYATNIDGKTVIYQGCIRMTVKTKLKFQERLKILFGAEITNSLFIYTKELVNPVGELVFTVVVKEKKKKDVK